ncbi:hypothetical protein LG324_14665 [Phycicoccus jejuensis]|uniref:hypothetical protein n=1 Tax=Phycicoccus jejuensis TaxID=367299 RepID=UPI0038503B1B
MSRSDLDATTRAALTALDPAPRELDPAQQRRAAATLERVLAAPPAPVPPRPAPRRRTGRRLALTGALAAATTVVGVVGAQVLTGGDSAYATWTATPHRPTTPEQLAAADDCRDSLVDTLQGDGPDPTGVSRSTIERAPVVAAEQRGAWTLVVLGDDRGFDATCITEDRFLGGTEFGSMGYGPGSPIPGPREVAVTSGGSGGSSGRMVSVLVGLVGPQVAAVTVHTPDHGDVVATVAGGHLAAWWPGPVGVTPDDPALDTTPPATVTYTDGSTREVRLGVGERG